VVHELAWSQDDNPASRLRREVPQIAGELEALKGKLDGFHSIRINDQWRVVFRWTTSGPAEVDIRDYH
jgi:toxin HigB-1